MKARQTREVRIGNEAVADLSGRELARRVAMVLQEPHMPGGMTVAQRVQFAIKGGSDARRTLIRDSNKVVQRAVLQSPLLTLSARCSDRARVRPHPRAASTSHRARLGSIR